MLALIQCEMRGIQPVPINTFSRLESIGRHVRKGQKAISLVMPIICKKRDPENQEVDDSRDTRESECLTFAMVTPDAMSSL